MFGANGAGKTSVLEAIFLLGRGRSFRTRLNERLIRHGQAQLRVVGRTVGGALPHVWVWRSRGTAGRERASMRRMFGAWLIWRRPSRCRSWILMRIG
jgi:recombinational DNA repair ATPase RecF